MTFVLCGLLRSGNVLIRNVPTEKGRNIALQALFPRAETSSGVSRPGISSSSSSRPLGGQGEREGSQGAPGVVSGGLPLLPLDLGPARGVGVPLGCRLGRVGSLPLLLLLRERAK